MTRRAILLLALLLWLPAGPAAAHKPSDAYLTLRLDGTTVEGQWDIALRDLEHAIGLDADGDGAITWRELAGRESAVAAYAVARLTVTEAGASCLLAPRRLLVDEHTDGTYAVLQFTADCPAGAAAFAVDYRLFADLDPLHRGLLRVEDRGLTRTAVLGPEAPGFTFARGTRPSLSGQAWAYVQDGFRHILLGYDHVLFLLTLLLPAVVLRADGGWRPVGAFAPAALDVAKIVTAFTLAHSLTLALATLHLVDLPSRLVESAIAATIVLAALNNLHPVVTRRMWLLAFGFGLVHGLGFAGALAALGLPRQAFLWSLLAFNLGIELGQLAIVVLFLPVAYVYRTAPLYPPLVLRAGSCAIIGLGGFWLVSRVLPAGLPG